MAVILAFIVSVVTCTVQAQSKWVFENYNYIRQPDAAVFVPMIHFETGNNWYTELRYNYEDARTLSVFAGKTLAGGKDLQFAVTPMAGYSTGRFTGVSFAANTDLEWKNFYLSAQSQYSMATIKTAANFFFNWSELGYAVSEHFFTGVAVQYTMQEDINDFEPGLLAGFNFKNVSFPIYVFSPFRKGCYFILGLNYEYSLKKKK
jgi:hypothetical protein